MTCAECKYQWCWLCEGEYKYGHYGGDRPCSGLQFKKINYLSELPKEEKIIQKQTNSIINRINRRNNNEEILRYIGPEDPEYKTTLRINSMGLIILWICFIILQSRVD